MQNTIRWGRWLLDGEHLVYHPDPGVPDPEYELNTSLLECTEDVERWTDHLRSKSWVQADDLTAFYDACNSILNARLVDERNPSVPQAMPWEEYRDVLKEMWERFLTEADSTDEAAFQSFIEHHPGLLPGPYGGPRDAWHGPLHGVVFTQPELPGFRAKRPDFLILEQDSATIYAVLIEIEAPAKPWVTERGVPSAALTQAIDQIRGWKSWFSEPHNVIAFQRLYNVGPEQLRSRRLVQHYILVYGRREEATRFESFAKKRHDLAGPDEFFMTYDRLKPDPSTDLTVRFDRSGPDTKLRLVSVPPTFELERKDTEYFSLLLGREEAILSNSLLSDARKKLLLDRIRFADQYAAGERRHL